MTSQDLTPDQLRRVRETMEKRRAYLVRLVNRCRELQFDPDDRLLHAAEMCVHWHDELHRAARVGSVRHGWVRRADPFSGSDPDRA
jgi:hypothetical protein